MPRKPCYWTRKMELDLVEFIKQRDYIWKPVGNTNHHIQRKYKAYAEFASRLGSGFSARAVRDRWVNIRSTFNHNMRKMNKSKESTSSEHMFVPCWPLWKPLQFLTNTSQVQSVKKEDNVNYDAPNYSMANYAQEETSHDYTEDTIRQRFIETRPKLKKRKRSGNKCLKLLNDLAIAMKPLSSQNASEQPYWFFGKHVTERLNAMSYQNADVASREIEKLLESCSNNHVEAT